MTATSTTMSHHMDQNAYTGHSNSARSAKVFRHPGRATFGDNVLHSFTPAVLAAASQQNTAMHYGIETELGPRVYAHIYRIYVY